MLKHRKEQLENKALFISCVVPVFNESANIVAFTNHLRDYLNKLTENFEIILVDDGSQDETPSHIQELAKQPKVKGILLSRNFGKETALTAGLEHTTGDVTFMIDGDFQHPLDMLPKFLEHWVAGYDMVYGVKEDRKKEPFLKRHLSETFYRLMQHLMQIELPPNAGDFRLLDKKVVQSILSCKERNRFMKGLYAWVGFKSIGLPFQVEEREHGQSGWSFARLFELAITAITAFSNIPLRLWGFLGLIISLCSFVSAMYIIIKTLVFGVDVPGYASIFVAVIFFGGVQLLSIGILGEYIARIFNEVKQRPQYIIDEKVGF